LFVHIITGAQLGMAMGGGARRVEEKKEYKYLK